MQADNQVNLAIKGIIAIQAMSEMSASVGQVIVAKNYSVGTNFYRYKAQLTRL